MCLNFSGFVRNVFSCLLAWIKFSVFVIFVPRLGLKLSCLFPFLFYFIVDLMPFISPWIPCRFFSCFILIRRHLTLVVTALAPDVCFILFEVMYIDVFLDVFIWTVNWLHYLNYEAITLSSSTYH